MEKKWYQKSQIQAAFIIAIGGVIVALINFNRPLPRVEVQYPEYNEPSRVESPVAPAQPIESSEEERPTVSSQSLELEQAPRTVEPVQRDEAKPNTGKPTRSLEANPNYVLEDGKTTFVSPIATSISATFQKVESVEIVTLVIAPKGRDALRKAVMGAGDRPIEFETDSGTYRAQVLSIEWNRKKATISITQ